MNKIFTFCVIFLLLGSLISKAQTLQFVTADGTVVENGSVWTTHKVEEDPFSDDGGKQVLSGLYLKNTTDQVVAAEVTMDIKTLPTGYIQFCVLGKCNNYEELGKHVKRGLEAANAKDDLLLEWFTITNTYGTAAITLRADVLEYNKNISTTGVETVVYGAVKEEGPQITINFVYANPAGIENIENTTGKQTVIARYGANGIRLSEPKAGLNIVKLSNGKIIKQILR